MRNLVQKTITDKNGNTSRRWVKPEEASSASVSSIPAPKTSGTNTPEENDRLRLVYSLTAHMQAIQQEEANLNGYDQTRIDLDSMQEKLMEFEHRTLSIVKESMPKESLLLIGMNEGIDFTTELIFEDDDRTEQTIRESLVLRDCFDEYCDPSRVASVVNGLHSYPSFRTTDLSELEGKRLDSARALCKVTMAILNYLPDEKSPLSAFPATQANRHITDKQLVGTVANNPERVDEIINLIVGREQADNWLIQNYLRNNTPLAEGVL